jgi:hypothetical protein
MNEEFGVLASKITKYINDASIVAQLSHWNVRGPNFYETHLLFGRIYEDISGLQDANVEQLRACGFNPDFNLFTGPGISMEFFDAASLIDLNIDYLMALSSAIAMFYSFAEEHAQDPRLVAIGNQMQAMSSVVLGDLYLLQAAKGF